MSNTSKGRATKGSKLMIQMAASPLQKHIIDEKLGEEVVWLSPIEDTDYEEYQMSEAEVCNFLGLDNKKDKFPFGQEDNHNGTELPLVKKVQHYISSKLNRIYKKQEPIAAPPPKKARN